MSMTTIFSMSPGSKAGSTDIPTEHAVAIAEAFNASPEWEKSVRLFDDYRCVSFDHKATATTMVFYFPK